MYVRAVPCTDLSAPDQHTVCRCNLHNLQTAVYIVVNLRVVVPLSGESLCVGRKFIPCPPTEKSVTGIEVYSLKWFATCSRLFFKGYYSFQSEIVSYAVDFFQIWNENRYFVRRAEITITPCVVSADQPNFRDDFQIFHFCQFLTTKWARKSKHWRTIPPRLREITNPSLCRKIKTVPAIRLFLISGSWVSGDGHPLSRKLPYITGAGISCSCSQWQELCR